MRGLYQAFARGDTETAFAVYARDIEWDNSSGPAGIGGVYHGHEGVRMFWHQWLDAWEHVDLDLEELLDAGEDVVAVVTQRNRGRSSGIVVEQEHAAIWTVRDGKIVRMRVFDNLAAALEFAVLAE